MINKKNKLITIFLFSLSLLIAQETLKIIPKPFQKQTWHAGPITYYINIMSEKYLMEYVDIYNNDSYLLENFPGAGLTGVFVDNNKKARTAVTGARSLMTSSSSEYLKDLYSRGGRLLIGFDGEYPPPYIDIPVPKGKYYLSYFITLGIKHLWGDGTKGVSQDTWHPNYQIGGNPYNWGPSTVYIANNKTQSITFTPNRDNMVWKHPGKIQHGFEGWKPFMYYIRHLNKIGEINLTNSVIRAINDI